jgi:DNA repair exonuclease SbcCD ATPase subunit
MLGVKVLFKGALMLACLPVLVTAAEPPKPQPSAAQLRDAQNAINRATSDVNQGADALPTNVRNAQNQLDRLNKNFDREVKPKLKRAKDKADEAAKAAKDANDAAHACDKTKFARLSKRAQDLMKESRDATTSADAQANVAPKLNDNISNLQSDKPLADAKAGGLSENSDAVQGYGRAQARAQKQVEEQQENINKVDRSQRELNEKMVKAKADMNPADALKQAEADLQDGEAWLKENCPPKTSAVPRPATDVYVAVNNQAQTLACFAGELSDQDAQELKQQLDYEVIAKTPTGTLIRSPQSAQTIELIANGRRIKLCFPPEVDVCLIMTPLTPFRGHDHATHQGGAHEHRPSDLPLDWGVTPPETIIRWQEEQR